MTRFLDWLHDQAYRDDLVGELATQVRSRSWPASEDLLVHRVRLASEQASPLAHRALDRAWSEWERSRDLPRINVSFSPSSRRS